MRLAFYLLIALTCEASAQIQPHKNTFARWDKNGDGKLTRNELPAHAKSNFDHADKNNNGFISLHEDQLFRKKAGRKEQTFQDNERNTEEENIKIIETKKNIPYAENTNPKQTLHMLLPRQRKREPLPVLVYVHGGAWKSGNKSQGIAKLTPFVKSGKYAGISVGYRLSDEAKWPAQIHDCKAAIRWIRGNAIKYGLDPTRIGAFGNSAGAHLVAMLGTSGRLKELEGDLGKHADQKSSVQCVGNFYGPSALLEMSRFPSKIDHDAAGSPESRLIGGALTNNKQKATEASPITYVSKDDCPMIHIHGTDDELVPYNQSVILHKMLLGAGCDSTLVTVKDGGHGGFKNPEIEKRMRNFFAKHLLGADLKIRGGEVVNKKRR